MGGTVARNAVSPSMLQKVLSTSMTSILGRLPTLVEGNSSRKSLPINVDGLLPDGVSNNSRVISQPIKVGNNNNCQVLVARLAKETLKAITKNHIEEITKLLAQGLLILPSDQAASLTADKPAFRFIELANVLVDMSKDGVP